MADSTLSPLEQLPVEIIQHIFFDSLEVNLPSASQTLNRALSKKSIYRALILFAYFDDDGENPVETKHFRPAKFRRLSLDDRVRLQVGILKCRWCTLEHIKSCMPTLSRLVMVQAWHEEQKSEHKTYPNLLRGSDRAPADIIRVPNQDFIAVAPLPDLENERETQQHFSAKRNSIYYTFHVGRDQSIGPATADGFLPLIQCWEHFTHPEDNPDDLVHKIIGYARATLGTMVIPDKLLEGSPWTEEKIEFLQLLRQGLRFKRHSDFIIVRMSAMLRGMESAIREGKVEILRVLIELHHRIVTLYQDRPDLDESYEQDQEIELDEDPPHAESTIPSHLFHLTTKQGPLSSALLSLLLRTSWKSVNPDDPVLTGWALRAKADHDPLGRWLMKYMEGAYDDDFRQHPVFINGATTWRLREQRYPFPETSFTAEVGYIRDFAPDGSMSRWPE